MRAQFVIPVLASILILSILFSVDSVFAVVTEEAKITASDAAAFDQFGNSISISGDTVIVGAAFDDDVPSSSGSAYVFERDSGGNWNEVAKLTASDAAASDFFGVSVSISEDIAIVGASSDDTAAGTDSGSAYVFVKPGGGWAGSLTETAKLTASDAAAGDLFGLSVSILGDTVIVGAPFDDSFSGSAYVFGRDVGGLDNWGQVVKLTAFDADAGDFFGRSVSILGDTVIVGAPNDDVNDVDTNAVLVTSSGSASVFVKNGGTWTQTAKLTASDAADFDLFGFSVSISGDTVIVGADHNDDACPSEVECNSGSAYVFVKPGGGWAGFLTETAKLTASDAAADDSFGFPVSILGDTAIVGARFDDSSSGSAYVFVKPGGGWAGSLTETAKLTASDAADFDQFGNSISISGDTVIVAALGDDTAAGTNSGSAYVFVDTDGDGIFDNQDDCPDESAIVDGIDRDANNDGCLDTTNELLQEIREADIQMGIKNSLIVTVVSAFSSYDGENNNTGNNKLESFINEVSAHSGKAIPTSLADLFIGKAENIIALHPTI